MKHKTIWILNHHATGMAFQHGGRHYYFAKYLIERGYKVIIFCASSSHGQNKQAVDLNGGLSIEQSVDNIPFVFVKTRSYADNGAKRVLSMVDYYCNVKKVAKKYDAPDVIIGSSVHPLACVAAINLSKRYKCKNIVEIRDLWPESIVAYGIKSPKNPIIKVLYHAERWLYSKADSILFTFRGGRDYIIEKKWDKEQGGPIDLGKIYHINNGVDLDIFESNCQEAVVEDSDLSNPGFFNLVYAGSIRRANNIDLILDTAKLVTSPKVRFLIWGDGDQLERLQTRVREERIQNVLFKGKVEKQLVPSIVSQADATFFVLEDSPLFRFGLSLNKSFEYLAAGKPLIIVGEAGYSMIDEYNCGYHVREHSAEHFAQAIDQLMVLDNAEYMKMCSNSKEASKEYDFKVLTNKLIGIVENLG